MPTLVHLDRHEEAAPVATAQHGRRAAGPFARRLGRRGKESGRHLLRGGAFRGLSHTKVDKAGQVQGSISWFRLASLTKPIFTCV